MSSPEVLHVDLLPAPPSPLVLCSTGFLTTLREVETQVTALKITDAQSAQSAANLLQRLTSAGKGLNDQRLALTRPFQSQIDNINNAAKAPAARIENLKSTLKTAQVNWDREQVRLQREAEAAKQAELARLEAIRVAEEKAAKERAAAIAAEVERVRIEAEKAGIALEPTAAAEECWDELAPTPEPPQKTETEKQIEALKFAPAPVVQKAAGVMRVVTLFPHVEDVSKLPDFFVTKTAKLSAIQQTFCVKWKEGEPIPELAGVRFEIQTTVKSTGRAQF